MTAELLAGPHKVVTDGGGAVTGHRGHGQTGEGAGSEQPSLARVCLDLDCNTK